MINQSRRTLLKSIGYGLAIPTGLAASAAIALTKASPEVTVSASSVSPLSQNDITIYQQKSGDKDVVTLMNQTDRTVTLDTLNPIELKRINGSLLVKVNAVPSDGTVAMLPGERFTFDIDTVSANIISKQKPVSDILADHLQLSSEHPAFNMLIPVSSIA